MISKSLFLRSERTVRMMVLNNRNVMHSKILGRVTAGTLWYLILDRSIPSILWEKTETWWSWQSRSIRAAVTFAGPAWWLTLGVMKAILKLTSRRGRCRRGLVYSPFARRQHILAQRASANFTTGATATMALVLWNQEYYTTMDMVSPKR